MLTLAFVIDGEVNFWFNVFSLVTHCKLSVSRASRIRNWGVGGRRRETVMDQRAATQTRLSRVSVTNGKLHAERRGNHVAEEVWYGTKQGNYNERISGLFRVHLRTHGSMELP